MGTTACSVREFVIRFHDWVIEASCLVLHYCFPLFSSAFAIFRSHPWHFLSIMNAHSFLALSLFPVFPHSFFE